MLADLIKKNRSYRRFDQSVQIDRSTIEEFISNACLTPSAANFQPLRYIITNHDKSNQAVFACLKWAGYLQDWVGPQNGEQPSAYITILCDKNFKQFHKFDAGIVAQTIMLSAVEKGFGGCIIAAIDKNKLAEELKITDEYEIILVLALGKPIEKIVIEDIRDNIKYYRDENQIHHVPKRNKKDVIIG